VSDLVDALAEAHALQQALARLATYAVGGDEVDGAVHAAVAVATGALHDVEAECAALEDDVEARLAE